ncbi:MAG: GlmL-related ornithine degradation protein [Firmicutes bacterium]|nr:GlmL-related ornithine degradation protein [Bacillota bacterium]
MSTRVSADLLVAEIGSTTTVVTAFGGIDDGHPHVIGQGSHRTTVLEGDVWVGLSRAVRDLADSVRADDVQWKHAAACSSAAGGLRMTVHGLVYDMTVRAAKEAALGAGAIVKMVTAGKLTPGDLDEIREVRPTIILLAGGVDWGERETAIHNARAIASMRLPVPVIYAGNTAARNDVRRAFEGSPSSLRVVDNVYPRVDVLDVEPARKVIQEVFEEHIVGAPGMFRIREWADGPIMPVPGAVMAMAKELYEEIGDLMVVDVGGATTDIHSVTEGTEEIRRVQVNPEPLAKRTVEGDLGVYVNASNIVDLVGADRIRRELGDAGFEIAVSPPPIPTTPNDVAAVSTLARHAVRIAIGRHVGQIRELYGPGGRQKVAEGRDLTAVRWIIGTGGVMARIPGTRDLLGLCKARAHDGKLLPGEGAVTAVDSNYIMAAAGVMSRVHPEAARVIVLKSLGILARETERVARYGKN